MPEPLQETVVTFATGATTGAGRVAHVESLASPVSAVVVDSTPFHPVDHTWPDQPGDTGRLGGLPVVDAQMAAVGPDGVLRIGQDVTVKRGEPGWTWLVVHLVEGGPPTVGEVVALEVDAERRADLSAAHTACHLAALAMNRVTSGHWREDKVVRRDSLGAPDLDQLAMVSSVMDRAGSTDIYRLGKSLRRKGFDAAGFLERLDVIVEGVRRQLASWVASDAVVRVEDEDDRRLTGFRWWMCELPDGTGRMPCGGTHVSCLGELVAVDVEYEVDDDGSGLTVRTTPSRAT